MSSADPIIYGVLMGVFFGLGLFFDHIALALRTHGAALLEGLSA